MELNPESQQEQKMERPRRVLTPSQADTLVQLLGPREQIGRQAGNLGRDAPGEILDCVSPIWMAIPFG